MRPRFAARTIFLILLVSGLGIGGDRRQSPDREAREDEERFRKVGLADCTFEQNPDRLLTGVRRTMEDLSTRTERVVRASTGNIGSTFAANQIAAFTNDIPSRGY